MADPGTFMLTFSGCSGCGQLSVNTGPASTVLSSSGIGVALVFTGDRYVLTSTLALRPPYDPAGKTTPDTPSTVGAVDSTPPSTAVTTGGGGSTYGDWSTPTLTMLHPLNGRAPMRSPGSFSATPYTGSDTPLDTATVTLYDPTSRSAPVCSTSTFDASTHHPVKLVPLCASASSPDTPP
jgi:hypothetical protein